MRLLRCGHQTVGRLDLGARQRRDSCGSWHTRGKIVLTALPRKCIRGANGTSHRTIYRGAYRIFVSLTSFYSFSPLKAIPIAASP